MSEMEELKEKVDDILERILIECGGLGKLQWIVILVVIGSKLAITWSMLMMSFAGATPDWWCAWANRTSGFNDSYIDSLKSCRPPSNSSFDDTCLSIRFSDEMSTVVSEWNLICDEEWITSTITTIQMGGLLASGFIAGQVADLIGRKPTFFLSLVLLAASNLVCGFSTSWQMFAVARFVIGLACGMYLTVFFNFVLEFIPTRYRAMVMAIPAWPVFAAFFGLVCWWLRDWQYIHYATAIITAPFLLGIFVVPESFRWLVSHLKTEKAEKVINHIAKINGKKMPDVTKLIAVCKKEAELKTDKKYSLIDIFRDRRLTKHSFLLWFIWLASGYSYYAISFGVEELSGDLYLNMFLLSAVEIPAQAVTWFFNNCIGRRWTCFMFYMVAAVGGIAVGTVQVLNPTNSSTIINGCAMVAKLGVAAAWASLMTFTTETYPTVVRNIGYGCANSISRVGAMAAPQIVQLSKSVSGLMYFLCGTLMFFSAISAALVPDTKGKVMENQIRKSGRSDIYQMSGEMKEKEGIS
ncbi:solute carrier family 22 member 4-like [Saccostrea echinata]|uniref:solute carrier family 22 member 4-like n=1 Tax=Saccostrea echinata TaxID=191078 RepID=UPI002A7F58B9|nr:solute carrier family 22 member 4-like [Saccostrea echinata]